MQEQDEAQHLEELVRTFLAAERIAIWGIEDRKGDPSQLVAKKFRKRGVDVVAVNPAFEDDPDLGRASSLTQIDPKVEAVLLYVDPEQAMAAVEDCIEAGTPLVWLHDALSPGAATQQAIDRLRSTDATVIPGLCPMFFMKPVDPAHFCLKWILHLSGKQKRTRDLVS